MLADLNEEAVKQAAAEIGCDGMACDVTEEAQIVALVEATGLSMGDVFVPTLGLGEGAYRG